MKLGFHYRQRRNCDEGGHTGVVVDPAAVRIDAGITRVPDALVPVPRGALVDPDSRYRLSSRYALSTQLQVLTLAWVWAATRTSATTNPCSTCPSIGRSPIDAHLPRRVRDTAVHTVQR